MTSLEWPSPILLGEVPDSDNQPVSQYTDEELAEAFERVIQLAEEAFGPCTHVQVPGGDCIGPDSRRMLEILGQVQRETDQRRNAVNPPNQEQDLLKRIKPKRGRGTGAKGKQS